MTLVLCKVEKTFGMWFPGMIAGWSQSDAEALARDGVVTILPAQEVSGGGEGNLATVAAAQAAETERGDAPTEDIPVDWTEMHHLKLIPLAKKIAGPDSPENATKEWAIGVIQAEMARRAAQKE